MKVIYHGKTDPIFLENGKVYELVGSEIRDNTLLFDVMEEGDTEVMYADDAAHFEIIGNIDEQQKQKILARKVRFLGGPDETLLEKGKVYELTVSEMIDGRLHYVVVADLDAPYLFEADYFEVVEANTNEKDNKRD